MYNDGLAILANPNQIAILTFASVRTVKDVTRYWDWPFSGRNLRRLSALLRGFLVKVVPNSSVHRSDEDSECGNRKMGKNGCIRAQLWGCNKWLCGAFFDSEGSEIKFDRLWHSAHIKHDKNRVALADIFSEEGQDKWIIAVHSYVASRLQSGLGSPQCQRLFIEGQYVVCIARFGFHIIFGRTGRHG